jgi:hypothetical protein
LIDKKHHHFIKNSLFMEMVCAGMGILDRVVSFYKGEIKMKKSVLVGVCLVILSGSAWGSVLPQGASFTYAFHGSDGKDYTLADVAWVNKDANLWFDGSDNADGWADSLNSPPCWWWGEKGPMRLEIIIDLGQKYDLTSVGIRWRKHSLSIWGTPEMDLYLQDVDGNWVKKVDRLVPGRDNNSWDVGVVEDQTTLNDRSRYIRFVCPEGYYIPNDVNGSIAEINFSGTPVYEPIVGLPAGASFSYAFHGSDENDYTLNDVAWVNKDASLWFDGSDNVDGWSDPINSAPCWWWGAEGPMRLEITIDLGKKYDLTSVGMRWRKHSSSIWGTPEMDLYLKDVNGNWVKEADRFVPYRVNDSWDIGVVEDKATFIECSQHIRLVCTEGETIPSNENGCLAEITLSGSPVIEPTNLTFSLDGGTYNDVQNVTISCRTSTAVIRYTTDGSDPSEDNGTSIVSGDSVLVDRSMTLKALAWVNSTAGSIKSAAYRLVAATPTFSPAGKYISTAKSIAIICGTPNAVIRYTTDGSDPIETSILYNSSVSVNNGITLKAKAWRSNFDTSDVMSTTYTIPSTYNRPETISYDENVVIDGDFSDWADTTWTPLDQKYDYIGATDVTQAFYSAKWGDHGNKVYLAVKVYDSAYSFTDTYTGWDARDAIEVYIHTTSLGMTNYAAYAQTSAQQYVIGIMNSNHNQVWTSLADTGSIPAETGLCAAGHADADGWIYYEVSMVPYDYFGGLTGKPNVISTLSKGDVLGLDVCVVGHDSEDYTGMKSENLMKGKSGNWSNIGLHLLESTPVPGDANGDGLVDVGDLGILAANYGKSSGATWAQGDFNNDGKVDVGDLGILAANYGKGTSSADFNSDYAKAFGSTNEKQNSLDNTADDNSSSICSEMGLTLIGGLFLMGLFLSRLKE